METSVLMGGPNMWDTWVSNLVSYADRFYFQLLRNASVVLLMTSVMVDHIPTGQENVVHHRGGGVRQEETNLWSLLNK